MQFRRLYMRNFLSVGGEAVEIFFPESNGITLIKGSNLDVSKSSSNGAGKSTIIEGILFGLYGETLRKLKKEEYYINEKATDYCLVELEFDNVKIVRRYSLDKKGKKKEGEVEFYIDGRRASTDASTKKVKEDIQQHIGVNFETMCNILIFGQHNMVSFLEAGEPEKREIVENLMNLREYNLYEEKAKKTLRETEAKVRSLSDAYTIQMQHFGQQIAIKQEQEKKLAQYQAQLDAEILALHNRLAAIPNTEALRSDWDRYNASEEQKKALGEQLAELNAKKNAVVTELNDAIAEKQKEAEKKQPLIDHYNLLESKRAVIDKRKQERHDTEVVPLISEKSEVDSKIYNIAHEYNAKVQAVLPTENWTALLSTAAQMVLDAERSLEGLLGKKPVHNETCPECFGKVDINNCENIIRSKRFDIEDLKAGCARMVERKKADLERIENSKAALKAEGETATAVLVSKSKELGRRITELQDSNDSDWRAAHKKLRELREKAKQEIQNFDLLLNAEFHEAISNRESKRDELSAAIGKINREVFLTDNAAKPKITLEELATIQANAENDRKILTEKKQARKQNPFEDIIKSLNANIAEIDDDVKESERMVKETEKLIPYYKFWTGAFGKEGIKSYIIDQIVPTLNQQINYWMQIIYQGTISVAFDKYLNVTMVNNASKNEMIFGQGSGGERRRIDIAIMLAFRQIMKLSTGHDPNIVFFDEVAENLDEEGVYRLHETLEDIAKTSRVYVVTHNPPLLNLLGSADRMNVVKKDGVMQLAKD